jgi:uncharacterized protein DUF4339
MSDRAARMNATDDHPNDWYVLRGRARGGPYPYAMVREGAKGGLISRHDLLWRPGWFDWRDAGAVDGLFAAAAVEPAAPEGSGIPDRRPASGNEAPSTPPSDAGPTAAAETVDDAPFNYVAAHWRGEFSVAAACFGNGTVVGLILLIAATILVTVLKENKVTATQYTVIVFAAAVFCLASIVWLLVGVCRSALRRWSRRRADAR